MDITAGLSGLKSATELIRVLREKLKAETVAQDEIAGRIGEIYDYIVDSKDALIDAKDEAESLKDQLKKLKEMSDLKSRLEFDGQVFWLAAGDKWDGPFCPICWNADEKLVPLCHSNARIDPTEASFDCHIHCRHFTAKLRANMIRHSSLPSKGKPAEAGCRP